MSDWGMEASLAIKKVIELRERVGHRDLFAAIYRSVYAGGGWPGHSAPLDQHFVDSVARDTRTRNVVVERDIDDPDVGTWRGLRVEIPSGAVVDRSGRSLSVEVPAWSIGAAPGFVFYQGTRSRDDCTTRIYLSVESACIPDLMTGLVSDLEHRLRGEFQLKFLAHPAHYDRADACVIYVRAEQLPAALAVVERLVEGGAIVTRPARPLLTGSAGKGIGFASPPPTPPPSSHGQWVTALLLESTDERDPSEALAALRRMLADCARGVVPWGVRL